MYLKELSAVNFKNIGEAGVALSPKLNCFIGDNGAGKTNFLDAVYYLSFCKSFFSLPDNANIKHGEAFFILKGKYKRLDSDEEVYCGFQKDSRKQFSRNEKTYAKLADHIGLLPLVMISPSDSHLIEGHSEERRKFMDGVIAQYDRPYLYGLINYNRILLQRNNLLKQFGAGKKFDPELLSAFDMQLLGTGAKIHSKRKEFAEKLIPVFQRFYLMISGGNEKVGLEYESDFNNEGMESVFKNALAKDKQLQFTTVGVHKDDLVLKIGDYPIKKLGSEGQKKSFLVSLKMAQFEFLKEVSGIKPILLLDDIFDKLDKNRVSAIVKLTSDDFFGQIFITDTNREHLDGIIRTVDAEYTIFHVANGQITAG
jgi:DNA replication and repair protein RecF